MIAAIYDKKGRSMKKRYTLFLVTTLCASESTLLKIRVMENALQDFCQKLLENLPTQEIKLSGKEQVEQIYKKTGDAVRQIFSETDANKYAELKSMQQDWLSKWDIYNRSREVVQYVGGTYLQRCLLLSKQQTVPSSLINAFPGIDFRKSEEIGSLVDLVPTLALTYGGFRRSIQNDKFKNSALSDIIVDEDNLIQREMILDKGRQEKWALGMSEEKADYRKKMEKFKQDEKNLVDATYALVDLWTKLNWVNTKLSSFEKRINQELSNALIEVRNNLLEQIKSAKQSR